MQSAPGVNSLSIPESPPWAQGAVAFVGAHVKATQTQPSVLEIGSGGSTLFLLGLGAHVTTVEHRVAWAEALQAKAESLGFADRLKILRRKRPYAKLREDLGEGARFDIVLLSGREQIEGLLSALPFLADDGLVLVDGSQKARCWPVFLRLLDRAGHTFKGRDRDTSIWLPNAAGKGANFSAFTICDEEGEISFPSQYQYLVPKELQGKPVERGFFYPKVVKPEDATLKRLQGLGLIPPRARLLSPCKFDLEGACVRIIDGQKYFLNGDKTFTFTNAGFEETSDQDLLSHHTAMPGRTLDISAPGAARYSFFLFDSLPKLAIAREMVGDIAGFDQILVNSGAEFLGKAVRKVCGDETPRIIAFNKAQGAFQLESSVHIEGLRFNRNTPAWIHNFLDGVFAANGDETASFGPRIYISRQRSEGRRIINHDAFMEVMDAFGFVEVFAEDHAPADLAARLAEAKIVISPHGAGLANIVFCPRETKVIELFSSHFTDQYFGFANDRGQDYVAFPCVDEAGLNVFDRIEQSTKNKAEFNRNDMVVPIAALESLLKSSLEESDI